MIGDPPLDSAETLLLSSNAIAKSESRTRRRVGILTGVGILLAFAAMAAFTFIANAQREAAAVQATIADQARVVAEQQTAVAREQRLAADEARRDLEKTRMQLETTTRALTAAQKELADSQTQVAKLRERLSQIYDFKQHVVPITEVDEKVSYGAIGPKGFDILRAALEDSRKKLPFNGANDIHKGFTSPGYAQYLLGKVGITAPVATLTQRSGTPQNGDIIAYDGGYNMFYFSIPQLHKEFVIGMTPEGVLALEPNFGTRTKVYAALQR
jgi:hypothetical protein